MAGVAAEIRHVADPREIVAHGILSMPGLIIDGRRSGATAASVGRRHRDVAGETGPGRIRRPCQASARGAAGRRAVDDPRLASSSPTVTSPPGTKLRASAPSRSEVDGSNR